MKTMNQVAGSGIANNQAFYRNTESGVGIPVRVANTGQDLLVAVFPEQGSSVQVEYTISDPREVKAETALWLSWDKGEVTETTSGALSAGISAVRVTSVGSVTWEVTA